MFIVQYVSRAFGIGETIPERLWVEQFRSRSLKVAREWMEQDKKATQKIWGQNCYGGHWRLISDTERKMTSTFICAGPIPGDLRPRSCEDAAEVEWTWAAGEPAPYLSGPEHWHGTVCPACHAAEEAFSLAEEASYVG